ncbi:MAG: lysine--tRNA ligase [Alphaproteobacteria bacterium]|nr:lysine--tRNA ligase [Alphaproteobacteria bacterium]
MTDPELRALARQSNAWPFVEARKLVERFAVDPPAKGYVLFETGYGPSGLPHIGTFGEVARTSMVRHVFHRLCELPSRLFSFSDDMDGLRRAPDNVPNQAMLEKHIGVPLTRVPDPFGKFESFGHHNNAMLRDFLDRFGFAYEFQSSTDWYTSGRFDVTLRRVLAHYDDVMAIMLPTLGPDRRATFSPFLPLCPRTGRVLQVPIVARDVAAGTVSYRDPDTNALVEVSVTGGRCKLGWKTDWAMRWTALSVDYEMSGKDLIDSVKQSGRICRAIGGRPPEGFNYELFLDEKGEKISKSKGNGMTIDEWLAYGTPESLSLFMYANPHRAKRLYFDVIPRHVDDYADFLAKFSGEPPAKRLENPVWHIHGGDPPRANQPLTYGMLLNLASVCNADDTSVLWGFIGRYVQGATPESAPMLDRLAAFALRYYKDFVKPAKRHRPPTDQERAAIAELRTVLSGLGSGADGESIQFQVYEVGKRHGFANLRDWFKALYQVLMGQDEGPRMGSFVALYGVTETIALIDQALAGSLTKDP